MQKWAQLPDLIDVIWEHIWQCVRGHKGYFISSFSLIFFFLGEKKQERRLEVKQCKSFGSFFKQESSFVSVVPSKLLGWLLSVQRYFWGILSCPLCKKWQITLQFPEPQQSIACPLQYLAQMDASEDAHRWRAESISSAQQQCCSLGISSPSSPTCAGSAAASSPKAQPASPQAL